MTTSWTRILSAIALAAAFSAQASARSIVIDKGEFVDSSGLGAACTIGQVCAPTTLPFTFDFGNGPTNLVYIYERGIVSFAGNSVPEPATWRMMIMGFGAIGLGLRRSRRRETHHAA